MLLQLCFFGNDSEEECKLMDEVRNEYQKKWAKSVYLNVVRSACHQRETRAPVMSDDDDEGAVNQAALMRGGGRKKERNWRTERRKSRRRMMIMTE